MNSFLKESAEKIFQNHSLNDVKDCCIVVPSRRAVAFIKKDLAALSVKPFLGPSVFAIDDFVTKFSGLNVADNIKLLFELYEVFRLYEEDLAFDHFLKWAPTVLSDFDLIDQYLVDDPQKLFRFMSEVEALKRWEIDELEELSTTQLYFDRFETIGKVYEELKKRLLAQNIAYRGMAYRTLSEEISSFLEENSSFQHFYFVGLNALSKSEISIIETLVKKKKATCIWDTDTFFMNSEHQSGNILRKYKSSGKFGAWEPAAEYLEGTAKNVRFYESSFDSLQPKIASQIINENSEGKTVFVVPDENQLQSVLFSLAKETQNYNISMGIGMNKSKIAALISDLFDLQVLGINETGAMSHSYILRMFKNPLIQLLSNENQLLIQDFTSQIIRSNTTSLTYFQIESKLGKVLTKLFFTNWSSAQQGFNSIENLFEYLKIETLEKLDLIEREFFFGFQKVIYKLKEEVTAHQDLEIGGLRLLLKEIYKLEKVAFEGDPNSSIQIMSLLETRCLDFENVIFISFNEGVLPSSNKTSSLIPYEACVSFGIPIYQDQDAIMAYHFYRLLMRAQNVDIVYTISKNGSLGAKSEASRIVNQLKFDLFKKNNLIKWTMLFPDFENSEQEHKINNEIKIDKTDNIITLLKVELAKENRGLSPSSITQYLRCPLQYYFSRIVKLKTENEIEESFGYNVFGNWIHETLEAISKEVIGLGNILDKKILTRAKEQSEVYLKRIFEAKYKGYEIETGWNHIFGLMAKNLVTSYYDIRIQALDDQKIENIKAEVRLNANLSVNGEILRLKGTIDAVELQGDRIKLIDYKTGKAEVNDLKIGNNEPLEYFLKPLNDKYRQLIIYLFLYEQNKQTFPASSGAEAKIYSFRGLLADISLKMEAKQVESIVCDALTQIVIEMLDPKVPICQTEDLKICEQCDFKAICNR